VPSTRKSVSHALQATCVKLSSHQPNVVFSCDVWKVLAPSPRWGGAFAKHTFNLASTTIYFFPSLYPPRILGQLLKNFRLTPSIFSLTISPCPFDYYFIYFYIYNFIILGFFFLSNLISILLILFLSWQVFF
jgi:hypothetical protein